MIAWKQTLIDLHHTLWIFSEFGMTPQAADLSNCKLVLVFHGAIAKGNFLCGDAIFLLKTWLRS